MNLATTTQVTDPWSLFVSGIMFVLSVLITLALAYVFFADPTRLTDLWVWVRDLPIVAQLLMWLIFLPWMVALWIWNTALAWWVRVVAVVAIVGFADYLLFPWKR